MANKDEWHACHFCGTSVKDGREPSGDRHWLSDCRPDLVEHEPGELCTWASKANTPTEPNCYAYQNSSGMSPNDWTWGSEHINFYTDGPM